MGKKKYNLCVLRKGATKEKPDYFKPCPKPEQTPRDSEGQGGLACCSPADCKDSDMTEQQQCDERFSPWNAAKKKEQIRFKIGAFLS